MWMFFDPSCQQYCKDTTFSDMSHVAQSHLDLGKVLKPGGSLQLFVTFLSRFCGNACSQPLCGSGRHWIFPVSVTLCIQSTTIWSSTTFIWVTSCSFDYTLCKLWCNIINENKTYWSLRENSRAAQQIGNKWFKPPWLASTLKWWTHTLNNNIFINLK